MYARLVVLLALAASVGCSNNSNASAAGQQTSRQVRVEAAEVRDVRRAVDVVGTLSAREDVVVSAEVAGRVSALRHDLGDRVETGDVLVELDKEKAQYGVEAQRAALAQSRAKYGASEAGDLPPLERVPEVVSAIAQLADAKQRLDRAKSLAAQSIVSKSDLDDAQTRLRHGRGRAPAGAGLRPPAPRGHRGEGVGAATGRARPARHVDQSAVPGLRRRAARVARAVPSSRRRPSCGSSSFTR